ncbi:MAG: hypothetical protein U5R30_17035 [Deltaproteobacteria bacterium]|nr:hypothetical protein [Deltaproteobacteria bacterium]
MTDRDDMRLKTEIDEIVAKIDTTLKKIEGVVPLNALPAEILSDEIAASTPVGDPSPPERSQTP